MKLFHVSKDGGKESNCTGYWLIEWKSVISVLLLKFSKRSRQSYHNHAFNCIGLVLKGGLIEKKPNGQIRKFTLRSGFFLIYKDEFHRVSSNAETWVFTIRGPWERTWKEKNLKKRLETTFVSGRKVVNETPITADE